MTKQAITLIITCVLLFCVDLYILSGIKTLIKKARLLRRFRQIYIAFSLLLLALLFVAVFVKLNAFGLRAMVLLGFFLILAAKIFFLPFILADDIRRGLIWIKRKTTVDKKEAFENLADKRSTAPPISRSEFLMKAGLISASLPLISLSYGIISGAYDYRIRRQKLVLKNLPRAFDGLKLAQVSDIH
ncbi:MAG: metallophosphoesterase, partial [Mucilaginibacter polytrichastri]|nr:metallophosphoesterase [Mucilaginibacter polytrichastri]